jgi:hypothetical protein
MLLDLLHNYVPAIIIGTTCLISGVIIGVFVARMSKNPNDYYLHSFIESFSYNLQYIYLSYFIISIILIYLYKYIKTNKKI